MFKAGPGINYTRMKQTEAYKQSYQLRTPNQLPMEILRRCFLLECVFIQLSLK